MEKKIKITNAKQFRVLVAELEKNPILANGNHRLTAPNTFKQDWEEIAIKLNAAGPPIRDSEGWLKVWRDFKFKVRRKMAKLAEIDETDSGRCKPITLHPLEKCVANVIESQKHLPRKSPVLEVKSTMKYIKMEDLDEFNSETEEHVGWQEDQQSENRSGGEEIKIEDYCILDQQQFFFNEEVTPLTTMSSVNIEKSPITERSKRRRSYKNDERQKLLSRHSAMQHKVLKDIAHTMVEFKNILKDSSLYQQKLCEMEEIKLKLMQQQNDREEQLFESEMKLKMLEMKIKTKELEDLHKKYN